MKCIGDIPISEINLTHIRDFKTARAETTSPSTQHQAHRVLKTFFNWTKEEGFMSDSPMTKNIKAPKLTRKMCDTYSKEDIGKFFALCHDKEFRGVRNRALIATLLDTGMRENEIVRLTLKDVNYVDGRVKIYHGKGNVERTVHLSGKSKHYLHRYMLIRDVYLAKRPAHDGHADKLFLSEERTGLTGDGVSSTISKLRHEADIPRPGVHKFRHTFAIEYLRNSGDLASSDIPISPLL